MRLVELDLADVIVGERYRKDLGNIDELAANISQGILLQPIGVRLDNTLIFGQRRLEAFRQLGRTSIPACICETLSEELDLLRAECDENTCRKDFTPEEAVLIGERIEAVSKKVAKQRQQSGKSVDGNAGGRGRVKENLGGNSPKVSVAQRDESGRATAVAAKAVGMDRRTYEKAKAVVHAAIECPDRRYLVDEMNRTGKVSGAAKKLKVATQAEAIEAEPIPLPTGPFRVIVVDPPWHFHKRNEDPTHRSTCPYPSMSTEEIIDFRPAGGKSILELAYDDAVLFLWTTNAHIREAFAIAEAWGFEYKTKLVWDKVVLGTGDWLRGVTEDCLLCVRGKPTVTLTNQTTLIREQRGEHSRKPEAFYKLVDSLCPGSKVEIFSRTQRDGWTCYGDECGTLPTPNKTIARQPAHLPEHVEAAAMAGA